MGKILNLSTPTVINTELHPLDESFWIETSDESLDQWYYDNTNTYKPDRSLTPLVLTPKLSASDPDTHTRYTPTLLSSSQWFVSQWDFTTNAYVENEITSVSTSDLFYKDGANLVVRKNVPYSHAIMIRCIAKYTDPRDVHILHTVTGEGVTLQTNRDATPVYPDLNVLCPSAQSYNPLIDKDSRFKMKATADWSAVAPNSVIPYKADAGGTEENTPISPQVLSTTPTLDIAYGDTVQEDQNFSIRKTSNGAVSEIPANQAIVNKIKGNTAAWNQLIGLNNASEYNATIGRIQGTNFWNVTTTGSNQGIRWGIGAAIAGHKYLVKFDVETTENVTLRIFNYDGGEHSEGKTINGKSFIGMIMTQEVGVADQRLGVQTRSGGYNGTFKVGNPTTIDLTLLGIDNLTTVEEVEAWLKANVGEQEYYPYCAGKLVNYGGYSVRMNQQIQIPSNSYTQTKSGVTITDNRDGSYTLSTDENGATEYTSFSPAELNSQVGSSLINHKLFVRGCPSGGNDNTYFMRCGGEREYGNGLIFTPTSTVAGWPRIYVNGGVVLTTPIVYRPQIIDLTEMFGAGNEPTLEQYNAIFTEDYYEYTTGKDVNLLDMMGVKPSIKTVGFNQWDEEWEVGDINNTTGKNIDMATAWRNKKYIDVIPHTTYYLYKEGISYSLRAYWYDANKQFIDSFIAYGSGSFTSPSNARYLRIRSTGGVISYAIGSICINISDPAKNGTYEPYWTAERMMDWVTKIGIKNFNIWDEEWEEGNINTTDGSNVAESGRIRSKNLIPVSPNTDYYYQQGNNSGSNRICYYDASKNFVSGNASLGTTFTTPNNAQYVRFSARNYGSTYNNDICINVSDARVNGNYVPYGETLRYFPDGMKRAGTAYDEICVENGVVKAVKCVGSVDLGSLTWGEPTSNGRFTAVLPSLADRQEIAIANLVCSIYIPDSFYNLYNSTLKDRNMHMSQSNGLNNHVVGIKNLSYSDASTFKTAMDGVMLYYELETPYEYILDLDDIPRGVLEWFGIENDIEVRAENLPWYRGGQHTDELKVDAMYGEEIRVVLRARNDVNGDLFPNKVYRNIQWRIPDVDSSVVSVNGSAVRSDTKEMTFGTVINCAHQTLSDDVKKEHLRMNWKTHSNLSGSIEVDRGWGQEITIDADALRHERDQQGTLASTVVQPYIYLLGAYEEVTDDGEVVTDNGEVVYDRFID